MTGNILSFSSSPFLIFMWQFVYSEGWCECEDKMFNTGCITQDKSWINKFSLRREKYFFATVIGEKQEYTRGWQVQIFK